MDAGQRSIRPSRALERLVAAAALVVLGACNGARADQPDDS